MPIMTAFSAADGREHTQDAYEGLLPRLDALRAEGRHGEALAALQALLQSSEGVDDGGWLRRSVAAHRALILLDMGRWEEALAEYEVQARADLSDPSEQVEYALGRAVCLSSLERHEEAIAVLEGCLARLPASHTGSALGLLYRLAEAYVAVGRPVPPQYAHLLRAAATVHRVEVSDALAADPARLGEAIMAVHRRAARS